MVSSMVGDICDEDELRTGLRREGMYGAVTGFALKVSLAITALTGGIVLKVSGYDAVTAEASGTVSADIIQTIRALFIGIQCLALMLACLMFWYYPITRAKAEETRRVLESRRNQAT